MQNHKICNLIGVSLLFLGALGIYTLPRLQAATPHRLPVENFPVKVGTWVGGSLQEVDPAVTERLKTAEIVQRTYTGASGQSVDLLLLTAGERKDLHDPTTCFPAQGWKLSDTQDIVIDGHRIHAMTAEQPGDRLKVWYWFDGYYAHLSSNPALQRLASLRERVKGRDEGMSLFVRLMAPDTEAGNRALRDFARSAEKPLRTLTASSV